MNDDERQFEDFVSNIKFDDTPDSDHRNKLEQDLLRVLTKQPRHKQPLKIWRIIMKSRITKLTTAAAVIILIAVISITFLEKSVTPAYGLDQTIEANRKLRYIHVRNVSPPAYGPQDMWLEFDENGELIRLRLEEGEEDNFRIMVWANNTIKWWSPPKNVFVILHETHGLRAEIRRTRELVDPRYAVQSLYDLTLEGKMDIEIEQPDAEGESITLTATDTTPLEDLPPRAYRVRYILLIDPKTKLAKQREQYLMKNGQYELRRRQLYLEYNEPIDPEMFDLEPPEEVELEDMTKGIGMPQGDMTDAEAAAEVVRQYIEALIAKDYEKASKLYNGRPADELGERVEKLKIKHLRFIAVGEPVPKPERVPRAFGVPFAFEIETSDGKREIAGPYGGLPSTPDTEANLDLKSHRQAMVRPVVGQPDRWVIIGGI
jgi:hypothetical protein